jgi:uncharacterized membrane protein YfcA
LPPDLAFLLPAGLDPLVALAMVGFSLVSSALTATFGLGGGSLMITVLVLVFPPAVAVPVHGLVQLGSNAGRAAMMFRNVQWRFAGWFIAGGVPGAFLGAGVATLLPEQLMTFGIAAFVLWTAWSPQPSPEPRGPVQTTIAGFLAAVVGMVTGVGGPLVSAMLRFLPDRRQIIATHAAVMTLQNTLKGIAFALFGFAFAAYVPIVAAMILSGLVGTAIGGKLLDNMPERYFRLGFKLALTAISLSLLWTAVFPP